MSTFISFVLIVLAVLVVGVIALVIVIKRKLRQGIAWGEVKLLEAALKELQERQAKATAPNQTLTDLTGRVEGVLNQAKAAMDKGDYKTVITVSSPILKELAERVQKEAEAAQAAQEAAVTLPEHQAGEPVADKTAKEEGAQKLLNPPAADSSTRTEDENKK